MTKFLINEAGSEFGVFPNHNIEVEAIDYFEEGSFTKFRDGAGDVVFSMKTESVKTIRATG